MSSSTSLVSSIEAYGKRVELEKKNALERQFNMVFDGTGNYRREKIID
jgi:hypothetical protein